MKKLTWALALLLPVAAGCAPTVGGTIQRGIDRYIRADYAGALNQLAEVSEKEDKMNDKGVARYLVFRGLAHYHLGQRDQAYMFLSRGKHVYSAGDPRWLFPGTVAEMDQALADLAKTPPPPPGVSPATTTIIVVPGAPVQ